MKQNTAEHYRQQLKAVRIELGRLRSESTNKDLVFQSLKYEIEKLKVELVPLRRLNEIQRQKIVTLKELVCDLLPERKETDQ